MAMILLLTLAEYHRAVEAGRCSTWSSCSSHALHPLLRPIIAGASAGIGLGFSACKPSRPAKLVLILVLAHTYAAREVPGGFGCAI